MGTLDEIDRQIVAILQETARVSNAEIARQVGMAPSAIYERIRKLEDKGVLAGYEARVDPSAVGRELLAFVQVRKECREECLHPEEEIAALPGVQEVHVVAGDYCYLVKVRAGSMAELYEIIDERIPSIAGVSYTNTIVVLKTIKESALVPLEREAAAATPGVQRAGAAAG